MIGRTLALAAAVLCICLFTLSGSAGIDHSLEWGGAELKLKGTELLKEVWDKRVELGNSDEHKGDKGKLFNLYKCNSAENGGEGTRGMDEACESEAMASEGAHRSLTSAPQSAVRSLLILIGFLLLTNWLLEGIEHVV